jgi:hypothetical protein
MVDGGRRTVDKWTVAGKRGTADNRQEPAAVVR